MRAWDKLGFHCSSILLIEQAVNGAKEEGDRSQDAGDQCEVEAGGDAFVHPGLGDGGISFTVALYKHLGFSWGGIEFKNSDIQNNSRLNVTAWNTV